MDTKTKIFIGIAVIGVIALSYYLYTKKTSKEGFFQKSLPVAPPTVPQDGLTHNKLPMPYTEPSLSCNLGMQSCVLSTGLPGLCDPTNRMCVEILDWNNRPSVYPNQPPIGQPSYMCTLTNKATCIRADGEMGFCASGNCYPESSVVQ